MEEPVRTHMNVFPGESWDILYLPESGRYEYQSPGGSSYRIGDYQLFDFIGSGGSCLVYKALDTRDGTVVMIKEFYPLSLAEFVTRSGNDLVFRSGVGEADRARVVSAFENAFRQELLNGREIRYTEDLNNDDRFLVATNTFSREGALNRFAVITTGAGRTLDMLSFSESGRGRGREILCVMLRLCDTVKAFHAKGHIHMDLNERNIFLRGADTGQFDDLRVSLIDFGSASVVGRVGTDGFSVSGSNDSAAPEQRAVGFGGDAEAIGLHSDVFSLVSVFRNLLARDAKSREYPHSHGRTPVPSFRDSRSLRALSRPEREELIRIVEKGCEQNPSFRYATAEELEGDLKSLKDIIDDLGVHPVIMRKRATERAQTLGQGIRTELLCTPEEL